MRKFSSKEIDERKSNYFLEDSIKLDFKVANIQNAIKSLLSLADLYQHAKNFGKLVETLETAKKHAQGSPKLRDWIQQRISSVHHKIDALK